MEFLWVLHHIEYLLSILENTPYKDRPPRWMWGCPSALHRHMKDLRDRRNDGTGSGDREKPGEEAMYDADDEDIPPEMRDAIRASGL